MTANSAVVEGTNHLATVAAKERVNPLSFAGASAEAWTYERLSDRRRTPTRAMRYDGFAIFRPAPLTQSVKAQLDPALLLLQPAGVNPTIISMRVNNDGATQAPAQSIWILCFVELSFRPWACQAGSLRLGPARGCSPACIL